MLRKTTLIPLLLLPIVCFSQSKLKGRFISNHYTRWVYNSKTEQDDQLGPMETCLIIRFSDNSVSIMQARGFQQQNYKVVSVSLRTKRTLDSTLPVKEFVYKLKDTHGHTGYAVPKSDAVSFGFGTNRTCGYLSIRYISIA
jgi:hypothetical protein